MGTATEYGRVGVLAGGPSSEREISLRSGRAVYNALVQAGVDAILLDVGSDMAETIRASGVDVAFIALHGRFGEDGTVQRLLEDMRVPYTGSGAESSSIAIDKIASKEVFIRAGLPVPKYIALGRGRSALGDTAALGLPIVVKPYLEGSSIGLSVVRRREDLPAALETAFAHGAKVLIEEYIDGRELTVGVLDDAPLPVIEIVPKEKVYDYKAKYSDPDTQYLVPAPLDEATSRRAQELGVRAHRALGCRCFSRVDMMLDRSGGLYILEANTIPGMTERSLLPKAAKAAGLDFEKLCIKLVEDALERWR